MAGRVREELRRSEVPLLGIGVGVSGVVHPENGLIRYSIPLQLEDPFDFRGQIAQGYDLPLFLENDANACAWGELAFHRSKRLRDFLFVLAEFRDVRDRSRYHEKTAVGMGIVIGGRVHYGHSYSAGEFRSVFCTPECRGQFSLDRGGGLPHRGGPRDPVAVHPGAFPQHRHDRQHLQPGPRLPGRPHRALPQGGAGGAGRGDPAQLALPGRGALPDPFLLAGREGRGLRRRRDGAAPPVRRNPPHRRLPAGAAGPVGRAPGQPEGGPASASRTWYR